MFAILCSSPFAVGCYCYYFVTYGIFFSGSWMPIRITDWLLSSSFIARVSCDSRKTDKLTKELFPTLRIGASFT